MATSKSPKQIEMSLSTDDFGIEAQPGREGKRLKSKDGILERHALRIVLGEAAISGVLIDPQNLRHVVEESQLLWSLVLPQCVHLADDVRCDGVRLAEEGDRVQYGGRSARSVAFEMRS
jgi:hypothetical protein